MNCTMKLVAALVATTFGAGAQAAVSADEAKALGTTLTAIGAEKAANKDGTIPAYTGGTTTAPAGYKAGDGIRPDPFAGEKPRLVIDAKNMAQHADKLTEGTKALLQKYPTFRVDVYPTHRSVAFPKFVADNTLKNATRAKTINDGRSMEGAHAGFPFPIPKTGYEAMWNHLVRFNGQAYEAKYRNLNVDANGRAALATEGLSTQEYPFWDANNACGRHLLAHQARLHRPGAPRRRGADARRPARHRAEGPPRLDVPAGPAPRQDRPRSRARHAQPGHRRCDDVRRHVHLQRLDGPLRLQAGRQEGDVRSVQRLRRRLPVQAGRPAQAQPPESRPRALGTAPRLGRRGDAEGRQAPRLLASASSISTRTRGRRSRRTSTTRAARSIAPASPTWRRATTCPRRTPTCSATTTSRRGSIR